jgi:hypothetical protein
VRVVVVAMAGVGVVMLVRCQRGPLQTTACLRHTIARRQQQQVPVLVGAQHRRRATVLTVVQALTAVQVLAVATLWLPLPKYDPPPTHTHLFTGMRLLEGIVGFAPDGNQAAR